MFMYTFNQYKKGYVRDQWFNFDLPFPETPAVPTLRWVKNLPSRIASLLEIMYEIEASSKTDILGLVKFLEELSAADAKNIDSGVHLASQLCSERYTIAAELLNAWKAKMTPQAAFAKWSKHVADLTNAAGWSSVDERLSRPGKPGSSVGQLSLSERVAARTEQQLGRAAETFVDKALGWVINSIPGFVGKTIDSLTPEEEAKIEYYLDDPVFYETASLEEPENAWYEYFSDWEDTDVTDDPEFEAWWSEPDYWELPDQGNPDGESESYWQIDDPYPSFEQLEDESYWDYFSEDDYSFDAYCSTDSCR